MLIPFRMSAQTDEQLMQRAANGSERAFEELYNRHARRLQGFFVRRLADDKDLAADFMHDTFLRLYAARENYVDGRNFRSWLYTIAYNLLKNHFRNQLTLVSDEHEDVVSDNNIDVNIDMNIFHNALREVLSHLPEPYAILFSLHYEEELTIPQIAQSTALAEGTVKSRLHKAMNTIKQQLKQYENK
ncbi:MAG: RNA polymerase sigma factor [Bacteroidales bacterium]|nr:RNA polymerase sigma factor [Bacteroidales bacterium]